MRAKKTHTPENEKPLPKPFSTWHGSCIYKCSSLKTIFGPHDLHLQKYRRTIAARACSNCHTRSRLMMHHVAPESPQPPETFVTHTHHCFPGPEIVLVGRSTFDDSSILSKDPLTFAPAILSRGSFFPGNVRKYHRPTGWQPVDNITISVRGEVSNHEQACS